MHELFGILRVLTVYKIWNALKVGISYLWAQYNPRVNIKTLPISLSIEPTTQCNLRCPECPSGQRYFTRATGMMDFGLFKKIIQQSEKYLIYLLLYFQGEPFLHPLFFKMIKYAHKHRIYTATSTNGHFLSKKNAQRTVESGLNKLLVSLDGTNQQVYEKYRKGGQFGKVVEGIKNLVEAKRELKVHHPQIVLQFIVFKHNQHQIDEFKSLAKELNVDKYEIKTAQVYNFEGGSPFIPDIEHYSRYKKQGDAYLIKSELPNKCWRMWHSCVITQSGDVAPCCFDKQADYAYANISEEISLSEAFHSFKAKRFRKQVFTHRGAFDICRNCTEGLKK